MLSFLNVITLKTYTFFTTLTPWLHGRSKRCFRGFVVTTRKSRAARLQNVRPQSVSFSVGNSQKSLGARSGEYGSWGTTSKLLSKNWWTRAARWGGALSWWKNTAAFEVSKTLLSFDHVTSIQRGGQCCHLASPNLKNTIPEKKKLGDLRIWMHHYNSYYYFLRVWNLVAHVKGRRRAFESRIYQEYKKLQQNGEKCKRSSIILYLFYQTLDKKLARHIQGSWEVRRH